MHGPPGYDWCRTYVAAASDADRTRETIPVLEDLVEREPGNTDAWRLLYQAAATSNDYDQATVALTIADYIEGVSTQEIVQLGDLYVQIGVPAKAVDYYARAIAKGDFSGSTDLRERLAYAYIAAHDYDAAIEYLSGTLAEEPSARLESLLGDVYYQLDDYENALRAFLRSFELDPEDCRSKFMTGYCAYRLDRDDEARRHLQRLLDDATCEDHHERALQLIRAIDLRL